MLTAAIVFVVSSSPCLVLAESGDAGQRPSSTQMAMARSEHIRKTTDRDGRGALGARVRRRRRLARGSEPDPEAFDRQGLDRWWQHHQQPHPAWGPEVTDLNCLRAHSGAHAIRLASLAGLIASLFSWLFFGAG
jgi:hypothetical protein